MSRFFCRYFLQFSLCLAVALLPAVAVANPPSVLIKDFKPVTAALVMPIGSEWIIDKDAAQGVKSGDLFSVVSHGKPIIHPLTKEILGTIDVVQGILQVTKVKTGYSYATVLNADVELKPGAQLKRFYNLPASFWDYTNDGEAVFVELQEALPHLEWQTYAAAQQSRPATPTPLPGATRLLFVLTDQGLAVKDNNLQPLRFYQPQVLAGGQGTGSAAVSLSAGGTGSSYAPGIVANPQAAVVPQGASQGFFGKMSDQLFGSSSPKYRGQIAAGQTQRGGLIVSSTEKREGVWYGPRMQGQPVGIEVADFDGDGQQEVAVAFADRIVVMRSVDGQLEQLASLEIDRTIKPLSIDGADLDHDGKVELYLTAVNGLVASSSVFEWQDGQLVATIQSIPWFLRKVTLPGEGEVLLGQAIDPKSKHGSSDYQGPVFRIARSGNDLNKAGEMTLPGHVELNGFLPYAAGGRSLLVNLNINDTLELLESNSSPVWESSDYYGGSQNSFERRDQLREGARYRFLKQRIETGPENTVLVPVNEGSRLTSMRKFKQSHLEALVYDGYSMVERWRTQPQGGYLADYRLADADNDGADEIVMLVQYAQGSWLDSSSGISALLFYEIQ